MDWRLKALAFRALEMPGGDAVHYRLQRHITRNWPRRMESLDSLAAFADRVLDGYAAHAGGIPRTVLEVGAGRDLAVPLAMRKRGVGRIIASDVTRLAKLDLVSHAARHLVAKEFGTWDDLHKFGIDYRAPHRVMPDDDPVDCSCSNEVLEHVPPDQLKNLLKALRTITRGVTIHSIDYSDHYARSDRNISRFNFLKFSDDEWRRFNSGFQYVNRLRHSDYLKMFREAGFAILEERGFPGNVPADLKIADQFRAYDRDDLFTQSGRIVAA